ncbi:hypothetical protein B0H13DRAFT_1939292 [Mycena leptocephala]|nr:hypothetical protein B0H13DRAFT_1939292 [Mycena leptocephala]
MEIVNNVPPTEFHLRPHHVGLLTLFILTFKEYEGKLPPTFLLHIYRVLLNEVVEVAPPKTYGELLLELQSGPKSEEDYSRQLIESFEACAATSVLIVVQHNGLSSAEEMTNFFAGGTAISLMDKVEGEEDVPPTLVISPFYYRLAINSRYIQLAAPSVFGYFCAVVVLRRRELQKEYDAWCRGVAAPTAEFPIIKDQLHSDTHIFRTIADKTVWAQPDAYELGQSLATGDESVAIENLRRYFEQHFHEHNDSMLHRLPPTIERRRPMLNEIQADLQPMEVLFDGQPLSASFAKIVQGMGLYDYWFDTKPIPPADSEQWHSTLSRCDRLSILEENLVIAFTDVGGEDNNRITEARQGKYEKSLSALLQPSVWHGLSLEVWHILVLRAIRRGQSRAYREILLPRRPPGEFKPRLYSLSPEGRKCPRYMTQCDQATSAVDGLLTALWHSEFLGRMNLYRTGIILLADRSRRILDEIMPQIISGQDLEQRALACFTLARCIIVAGDSTADTLREAVPYLLKSEQDYLTLEMHCAVMDVQYFLSVVYHNLGLQTDRDEAAKRHFATQEMRRGLEMSDEGITGVLEVMRMVGAALAHRSTIR